MTQQLEDRLRAAFRGKADRIPAVAPPLELTEPRGAAHPGGIPVLGRWLTPGQRRLAAGLAAAAAVAAIAAGTVVASGPSTPPAQPAPATKLPPYYVALSRAKTRQTVAVVRATRTGAVIARIAVPHPYADFSGVTAAADDRTFVLAAVSFTNPVPEKFFQLRIDPGARLAAGRARLAPLSVRLPSGAGEVDMALSPDGQSLAVLAKPGHTWTANRIIIYNLTTGASHSWGNHGCADHCTLGGLPDPPVARNSISWTADGHRLGFVQQTGGKPQFRVLNVDAPGDDVLADSQPVTLRAAAGVLKQEAPRDASWGMWLITPDGESVVIEASANLVTSAQYGLHPPAWSEAVLRYSSRTGVLQTVLGVRSSHHDEQVLWTSPNGSTILVTGFKGIRSAGLLHNGHYTPIPWSQLNFTAAW
jgi:hypothetical protein